MKTKTIAPFYVVGIAIRTTNEDQQAATDIPHLWSRFFSESCGTKITNKAGNALYCIYTDYEKDHTKPYTTILGYAVTDLATIPEGFVGKEIGGGTYTEYTTKGRLADGIVFNAWTEIWNTPLPRAYTSDFEVYGEKTQDPDNAEVEIYVAVK